VGLLERMVARCEPTLHYLRPPQPIWSIGDVFPTIDATVDSGRWRPSRSANQDKRIHLNKSYPDRLDFHSQRHARPAHV